MQDRERRKRYRDDVLAAQAPSKLIGYVSAGSVEAPGAAPAPKRQTNGRAIIVLLAVAFVLIWATFGGIRW